jgi:uncharacterized protein (UPF0254 family)
MLWVALIALASGTQPTDQALVYYNARMALREGHAQEAVKLWLLRNALASNTGEVSAYDADFHSVTWAALGKLGICQDGYPTDDDGAGLWPIALHNWVVKNMRRTSLPSRPPPFDAFDVGRQQRFISIRDVLAPRELRSVRLFPTSCLRPRRALLNAGEGLAADLSDRQVAARLLRHLLKLSRSTLVAERVQGRAAIEARLFDVDLQLAALSAREARRQTRAEARAGRRVGLSRGAIESMQEEAPVYAFSPDSEPARILADCLAWPASEWMSLSADRRLFLFEHAERAGGDPQALRRISLAVIDRLIDERRGEEVESWIAHRVSADDSAARELIWEGARGQRLLSLGGDTGFRERSVIALHRGVHLLESGDLPGALRSMAYALESAHDSRAADAVQSLSRRWLSFVASQFEVTDELLAMLQALAPRRDYSVILEDLLWHAAFNADRSSFDRGVRHQVGRGALVRRIDLLRPLSKGDAGGFVTRLRKELEASPYTTLRFVKQAVQRLEAEDADVRTAHIPTVVMLRDLLEPLTPEAGKRGGQARNAAALVARCRSILEGLGALGTNGSARDAASALAPSSEVFAGSVRLAPSDPLPWPFSAPAVEAPSIFTPLDLSPVEWRDRSGGLVFGWRIGE